MPESAQINGFAFTRAQITRLTQIYREHGHKTISGGSGGRKIWEAEDWHVPEKLLTMMRYIEAFLAKPRQPRRKIDQWILEADKAR